VRNKVIQARLFDRTHVIAIQCIQLQHLNVWKYRFSFILKEMKGLTE